MMKKYSLIVGSVLSAAALVAPFAAMAKAKVSPFKGGDIAKAEIHVNASTTLNGRGASSSAEGNAYGHLIAPGYIKNNGTTSPEGRILPPGIAKKLDLTIGSSTDDDRDRDDHGSTTATSTVNLAPVIVSITGPTHVVANATSTWAVNATDPESGTLAYRAVFGDKLFPELFWFWQPFSSSPVFTHTYEKAGTYTARFSVKDEGGKIVTQSLIITVASSTNSTTTTATSTNM